MTRRLFTTFLCLMLALLLPLGAFAATERTLTLIPGDELAAEPAVADLFNALSLKLITDGSKNVGAFSVSLSDKEIVTVALRADEKGAYLQSESLSDGVLYFTWDSLAATLKSSMQSANMDSATLATMEASLDQYIALLSTGSLASIESQSFSDQAARDKAMAKLKEVFHDDPEMISFVEDVLSRMQITDGDFTDAAHDPATQKIELTITNEDYARIFDSQYMKKTMAQAVAQESPDKITDAEKDALVEEQLAEMKKVFANSELNQTVTVYTADEGKTIVALYYPISMKIVEEAVEGEAKTYELKMDIRYDRLTGEEGVTHQANMFMDIEGESMMTASAELLSRKDGSATGSAGMLVEDTQISFTYEKTPVGETGADHLLSIYQRSDATALLAPAASDRPLLSFSLKTRDADATALEAILAATPDTAKQLFNMSAEESSVFMQDLQTRLSQTAYAFMSNLPESLLSTASDMLKQTTAD